MTETSLVDRFGAEGRRAWHLSRSMDDSPVVPLAHTETIVERTSLPFSSTSLELLITVVDTLLARAFSRPSMRGRYAGKAVLECALETGQTWTMEFSFKGGAGNRKRALSIIRPRLEEEHPSGPVEDVSLTLDDLTGESGTQLGLLPEARESRQATTSRGGQGLAGPHGRKPRPVPGGGGGTLASCPGDAGPAGSRRLIGKR